MILSRSGGRIVACLAFSILLQTSLLLVTSSRARAQARPDAGTVSRAADLASPEVHADGRVTFRLRAPQATDVKVAGEWTRAGAAANTPQPMQKDANGVWSVTLGPIEPNIYIYVFQVDGMTIVDPVNPLVKLRARTSASMVEIPGQRPWEPREVPRGSLEILRHTATSLGGALRSVVVYTPPGYDARRATRYPVLYLLHGNNDLEIGWTFAGRAHVILDNLIAEGKATPMIVAMPWGHALPFGTRPPAGQPSNNDLFARYLETDVVPLVDRRFRTAPGPTRRAIAGLSMGGAQALQIAMQRPERFGALGVFGSGMETADFTARYGAALLSFRRTRWQPLFIGTGKDDGVRPRAQALADALTTGSVTTTYLEVDGGHTYPVWRKLLVELVPLLFRKPPR